MFHRVPMVNFTILQLFWWNIFVAETKQKIKSMWFFFCFSNKNISLQMRKIKMSLWPLIWGIIFDIFCFYCLSHIFYMFIFLLLFKPFRLSCFYRRVYFLSVGYVWNSSFGSSCIVDWRIIWWFEYLLQWNKFIHGGFESKSIVPTHGAMIFRLASF